MFKPIYRGGRAPIVFHYRHFRYVVQEKVDRLAAWLARKMVPRRIRYWVMINEWASFTTRHSTRDATGVSVQEVVKEIQK